MFDSNDIYTVSSGVVLYNYWNPLVTKFDSSAFYNWEQDNLPLHDLEERTYYLWEKATGWATSSLPGLALVVSATIPTGIELSANVFTTVQEAVEALPEIIRMPVIIEVADTGDLGDLTLNNITCEDGGSLEIVNRVWTDFKPSSAKYTDEDGDSYAILEVSSSEAVDVIETTSALSLSANTSSLWTNPLDFIAVAQMTNYGATRSMRSQRLSTTLAQNTATDLGANDWISGDLFRVRDIKNALSVIVDDTVDVLDISSLNALGNPLLRSNGVGLNSLGANGFASNNFLRSIKVRNCNGPIWIRRFNVVGAEGKTIPYTTRSAIGIDIQNTDNITLEDCFVTRASDKGVEVLNSQVNLRRRFVVSRNYEPLTSTTRKDVRTVGINALNSKINFVGDSVLSGNDVLFSISDQDYGMILKNSQVTSENAGELHISFCATGMEVAESDVQFQGQLDIFNNNVGINSNGSFFDFDEYAVQYNDTVGIRGHNTSFTYGRPDVNPQNTLAGVGNGTKIDKDYTYLLHANGQHLVFNNCNWYPFEKDNSVSGIAATLIADHFLSSSDGSIEPAVDLVESDVILAHTRLGTGISVNGGTSDGAGSLATGYGTKGYLARSVGSTLNFIGSETIASIITGFVNGDADGAALAALNSATLKFQGPTFIGAASVDCYAENNSVIEFAHQDRYEWNLGASGNHTAVELHAIKSNLVAMNGSRISMKDLGDSLNIWDPIGGEVVTSPARLDGDASSLRYGGSMKLLCTNKEDSIRPHILAAYEQKYNYTSQPGSFFKFTKNTTGGIPNLWYLANIEGGMTDASFRENISNGGIVVRAHNNSTVDVDNVNFYVGPVVADEVYYDTSIPGGCNDLRIWAITGQSTLNASYCSVGGTWPGLAGHHGPRAAYLSGVDPSDPSSVAYGSFVDNPYNGSGSIETSTLSILDFYGSAVYVSAGCLNAEFSGWGTVRNANADTFGVSGTYANQGPFRIFFDVDSAAMALSYASGGVYPEEDSRPYQTIAQGYFLSADCSTSPVTAQSQFPSLYLFNSYNDEFSTSGYYLPQRFLDSSRQTIRLDESAANTFANAKHNSLEFLGRPKLVDIYKATNAPYGMSDSINTDKLGVGFKGTTMFDLRRN